MKLIKSFKFTSCFLLPRAYVAAMEEDLTPLTPGRFALLTELHELSRELDDHALQGLQQGLLKVVYRTKVRRRLLHFTNRLKRCTRRFHGRTRTNTHKRRRRPICKAQAALTRVKLGSSCKNPGCLNACVDAVSSSPCTVSGAWVLTRRTHVLLSKHGS